MSMTPIGCLAVAAIVSYTGIAAAVDDAPHTVPGIVITGVRPNLSIPNITATRMPLTLRQTPASITVVPRALTELQGAEVLGDALTNVAGIGIHSGFGVHDFFIVRGFDSLENGLVLIDNAAEPEVTFYQLYNIERIEVLRGPASVLYGGNPLASTVNLIRKQPHFDNFTLGNFSFGTLKDLRVVADFGRTATDMAFRLNGQWHRGNHYRNDKMGNDLAINPALLWRPNERSNVRLNLEYVRADNKPDSGLPFDDGRLAAVPRTRSYQSPFDDSRQDIYRFRLDAETRLGDRVLLRNKAFYTGLDWLSNGTLLGSVVTELDSVVTELDSVVVDTSKTFQRWLTKLDDGQKLLGNQLEALVEFRHGNIKQQLLLGLAVSRLQDNYTLDTMMLPDMDLRNPSESATEPLHQLRNEFANARSLVIAPYLSSRLVLSESLQFLIGGRFDFVDYEDPPDTDREFRQFSPMLGLVLEPLPNLTIYANYGSAFAPPSTRIKGRHEAGESTQVEFGARRSLLGDRGLVSVALFQLQKENIAIENHTGRWGLGAKRSRGIEAELTLQPNPAWQILAAYARLEAKLTRFQVESFDASYSVVSFDRSGNTAAFAPKNTFSLWSTWYLTKQIAVSTGARYVGTQFTAEDNTSTIDAAFTINAALSYHQGSVQWRLNLNNLTGSHYETRGFGAGSAIPAAPLTAKATVTWTR